MYTLVLILCPIIVLCMYILNMQIPLGVYLHNENKLDEMVIIMEKLQSYVPSITTTKRVEVGSTGDILDLESDIFHQVLLGGDYLTSARARGAKMIRANSERSSAQLKGLTPVTEDWHAKCILLAVGFHAWRINMSHLNPLFFNYRLFGRGCTQLEQARMLVHYTNYAT